MKIGAGVVMTSLHAPQASAQEGGAGRPRPARPVGVRLRQGAGFKYTANRLSGNGPMDETSRQIVSFVKSFSESQLTEASIAGLNKLLVDTTCALVSGFHSEPGRICARLARLYPAGELKSTIAGYGITTVPEMAAYANCFMVRDADYNDGDPPRGGHASVIIPGALAIGEALHSTGPQVLAAIAIGYEFLRAARSSRPSGERPAVDLGWADAAECTATALACAKLLGLNEDRLANALSLALASQLSLGKGDGTQSHFKAGHSALAVRHGVSAALMAREGITAPNAPFEGREGLFDTVTGPLDLRLPAVAGELAVDNFRVKRYPVEGNAQAMLHQAIPPIRKWTTVGEIASINIEITDLGEIASPECWDPSNRETADHSLPYLVAVALTDGEVYLDAFTPKRYLHDAALRQLIAKITCEANPDLVGTQGRCRWTVRKKTGEVMTHVVEKEIPIAYQDVLAKFDRVCAYMKVPDDQRDRAKATWSNLRAVKDIAEPTAALGRFGPPLPIHERAPYAHDTLGV
jgi:2-methylcitrate dehydratase